MANGPHIYQMLLVYTSFRVLSIMPYFRAVCSLQYGSQPYVVVPGHMWFLV